MTKTYGLAAIVAEVWAIEDDRALVRDGTTFAEVWIAPGDRPRYQHAKRTSRPLIMVGRWSFERTPRGQKRIFVASFPRDIALQAPRLARAITAGATTLPREPFSRDLSSARRHARRERMSTIVMSGLALCLGAGALVVAILH